MKKSLGELIDDTIAELKSEVTTVLQMIHSDLSNAVTGLSDESESKQNPDIKKDLQEGIKNVQYLCNEAIESLGLSDGMMKDGFFTMETKRKEETGLDDNRMTKAVKLETSTPTGD